MINLLYYEHGTDKQKYFYVNQYDFLKYGNERFKF